MDFCEVYLLCQSLLTSWVLGSAEWFDSEVWDELSVCEIYLLQSCENFTEDYSS